MLRPRSLFAVTGLTLSIAVTVFLLLSLSAITFYILAPVSRQAADDLAALMVLSAKTWVELPPQTRPDFEQELLAQHNLGIGLADPKQEQVLSDNPALYLRFLEDTLLLRTGQQVRIMTDQGEGSGDWLQADLPVGERVLRVSFHAERLGTHFPAAALWILTAGTVVILLTSLLLVRRITRPLSRMVVAAAQIGDSQPLSPLPETGPRELAALARSFNRMEQQVKDLLENRTTLLAGISHDLRTPISRMGLALEMLPEEAASSDLVDRLRQDLVEMDRLIGQTLELARGLGDAEAELLDIREPIDALVSRYIQGGARLDWTPGESCMIRVVPLALQRVLANLLDNAIRFSPPEQAVEIDYTCGESELTVRVQDRGPGIPPEQVESVFRPFYRLEGSRNRKTGGSGLGLAITRQLCNTNRWGIELAPRGGGGTEARLRIPRDYS